MKNQNNIQKRHEQLNKLFEEFRDLTFDNYLIAPYSHGKAPKPSTWATGKVPKE